MLFRRKHSDEFVIPAAGRPAVPVMLDSAAEREVRDLLAMDKKIPAIKRLRELTGLNLRDAKRYVDAMEDGRRPTLPGARFRAMPIALRPQAEAEIRRLIAEGKMIHAIKLVREQTGLGLRDAKEFAEAMAAGLPVTLESRPTDQISLADQARELLSSGDRSAAIDLIQAQTGMTADEAERFLTTLDDPF